MKLAYTIIYVEDVAKTVNFYKNAFNLKCLFLHESNDYAEMDTGSTKLAFASFEIAKSNGITLSHFNNPKELPTFEIAFVVDSVQQAYQDAIKNGATSIKAPEHKPWGQIVSYVKDCNGYLVELCSAMG